MTDYNEAYRRTRAFFGDAPDSVLGEFITILDPALPVLDVGCGQGRNALFLARQGFSVAAIDPSPVAVEQVDRTASDQGLDVRVQVGGFGEVDLRSVEFGAVMVFGLIPDLPGGETRPLIEWARSRVAPHGTLWLTGFTTEDPACQHHRDTWRRLSHNSYIGPDGTVRTYLERDEILALVPDHEVVHHWEGLGPEHRHGDGPTERHGRFEAIFRVPR